MKVPTILAVLAAIALTSPTHAAPSASPSNASAENGAPSNDGADLLPQRSNAIAKRAVTNDVRPYCVAVASNPPRVQIFKDKIICNGNGWSTLWTFTAHSKKNDIIATKPWCMGFGSSPSRSMLFPDKTTCKEGEWTTDFAFYETHKSYSGDWTQIWRAPGPDRILTYPGYDGIARGWNLGHRFSPRNVYRLADTDESKTLRGQYYDHQAVLAKLRVSPPSDATAYRCAEMLILASDLQTTDYRSPFTRLGKNLSAYPSLASEVKCAGLVNSSKIIISRVRIGSYKLVEFIVGDITFAAISVKDELRASSDDLKIPLFESLRTGQPIMVASNDRYPGKAVVAYVEGIFITGGDSRIWDRSI